MKIYIGTDHRGFELKEKIKDRILSADLELFDCGAENLSPGDDFVDIALVVSQKVATESGSRGILLCGSGTGVCIAANKIAGIRSIVGWSPDQVEVSVKDDDINILCLGADFVATDTAENLVKIFLSTQFVPEERFVRRIAKIKELETHA